MITQRPYNKASSLALSKRSLFLVFALIVPQLLACSGTRNQFKHMAKPDSITSNTKRETFQELGFFGDIKADKWNDFVRAVQNNITHSRKEQGNLTFSLYQPVDGKFQPLWFERFESKAAHNHHKEQTYFKDAITVIQQSLKGEASAITLEVLDEIPVSVATIVREPKKTFHVIDLFDVLPEKRQSFINTMTRAVSSARQAQGNLEYNLYRYADNPNKFVLMQGWQSQPDYEAQRENDHNQQLNAALVGVFVSTPLDTRWVVKDISQ